MRFFNLGFLGLFSLVLTACGGSVVTPGDTSGGGGSGGGSSNASTGAVTQTSTGSGDPATLCKTICGKFAALGCPDAKDCAQECPGAIMQAGECAPEFTAVLQCFADNLVDCDGLPQACEPLFEEFNQCTGGPDPNGCSPGTCDAGSDGTTEFCKCGQTCDAGDLVASCATPAGGGTTECTCYLNEAQVGTCQQNGDTCPTDGVGCCQQFFPL